MDLILVVQACVKPLFVEALVVFDEIPWLGSARIDIDNHSRSLALFFVLISSSCLLFCSETFIYRKS